MTLCIYIHMVPVACHLLPSYRRVARTLSGRIQHAFSQKGMCNTNVLSEAQVVFGLTKTYEIPIDINKYAFYIDFIN